MLRKKLTKISVYKSYLGYLNDAIDYISNADDVRLKILLTSNPTLIEVVFPDDNNLLGVAILKKASIQIIKTLIRAGVSINGVDGVSLPPLQAVPIINPNIEQLNTAYELVRKGSKQYLVVLY